MSDEQTWSKLGANLEQTRSKLGSNYENCVILPKVYTKFTCVCPPMNMAGIFMPYLVSNMLCKAVFFPKGSCTYQPRTFGLSSPF
jgi:hypothetical protein